MKAENLKVVRINIKIINKVIDTRINFIKIKSKIKKI